MALIGATEAAAILQVTPTRLYQLVRSEIVPAVRLGRSIRFDPESLRIFIEGGGAAFRGGWRREPV